MPEGDPNGGNLNFAFANSSMGFKLVVQKFESDDSPSRIIHFYENELARQGTVERDGRDLKAGPKDNQRVVSVKEREGGGSSFTLVRVRVRDDHR